MSNPAEPETITASRPDGVSVSLTLPGGYVRARELEREVVVAAGVWADWPGPGAQPGTVTMSVLDPTPQLATIEQLSLATVDAELGAGHFVVAVDTVASAGGPDVGRQIVSLYNREGTTTQRVQQLLIRAGRPVRLCCELDVAKWDLGLRIASFVAARVEVAGPEATVVAAADAMAPIAFDADGVQLEDLGDIASRQPFFSAHPPISVEDVRRLRGVTGWKPPRTPGLRAADLANSVGRLTSRGSVARSLLRKAQGRVGAEVVVPGVPGERRFMSQADGSWVIVMAETPTGEGGTDRTVDLLGQDELPLVLARWLGLAPGWPFPFEALIPGERWAERMADPAAPAPADAAAAVRDFWEQPWRLAEVSVREMTFGHAYMHWIFTPGRGACTVRFSDEGVTLTRHPTLRVLRVLTMMCDVIPRDNRADSDEPANEAA